MSAPALEKHYRAKELADLWGFSVQTIAKMFATEQGVIRTPPPQTFHAVVHFA